MRCLHNYFYFSRRYAQFEIASSLAMGMAGEECELSQEAQNALQQLNKRRQSRQRSLGNLNLPSIADCDTCGGQCCEKPASHYYTPIDYWLTKYSSGSTQIYAKDLIKAPHFYLASRFMRILQKCMGLLKWIFMRSFNMHAVSSVEHVHKKGNQCLHLGEQGCNLPYSERPMKCVIFACTRLMGEMDACTRADYTKVIQDLHEITLNVLKILKAETGCRHRHKTVLLMVTP